MATPFVIPPAPAPVAASPAAPGAVAAATAWTASEILKIRLEGPTRQLPSAYVGFVDIRPDSTSLADVRALIARDVDGAPRHGRYHFLFADGVPISRRQEASQLAMQLLPAVTIRASDSGLYGSNARPAQGAAEKVVFQFQDDQHTSWMPAGYTFAQLVADAARYWKLRPDDVILEDADGCAWPESVQVSSLVSLPLPDGKPFLLHLALKDGAVVLRERFSSAESAGSGSGGGHDGHDTTSSARGSGLSSEGGRTGAERVAEAQSAGSAPNLENRSPPTPSHAVDSSHQKRGHAPSAVHDPQSAQPDGASSPPLSGSDVDSELWNIFSYYCVHGDAKEVQHLRRHHWLQLMRDIGLLGPQLGNSTSCALFRVIYTAETRGSVGSSGKMNYAEFLDALMNVAVRACDPRQSRASVTSAASISPRAADTVDPATLDASFVDLLATYILPRAKRWNTHTWHQHTALLRSADVVHVVQPFLKPLYDIFRFYAPDPHSQADGTASVLHLYLDYTGFKKVFHDFGLKFTLGLSLQHLGEMFLAACNAQDGRFLADLGGHPINNSQKLRASLLSSAVTANNQKNRSETLNSVESTSYQSMMRPAAAIGQRMPRRGGFSERVGIDEGDMHIDYATSVPSNDTRRDRMYFEGFIDVLVRSALVGLRPMGSRAEAACAAAAAPVLTSEDGAISQLLPVGVAAKVLFQSLSRQLNKSSVIKILSKRKSTCAYPAGLMKGTMSLNAKYLAMWKRDGQVDYLIDGPALGRRILQPRPARKQQLQKSMPLRTSGRSSGSSAFASSAPLSSLQQRSSQSLMTPQLRAIHGRPLSEFASTQSSLEGKSPDEVAANTAQQTRTPQSGRALLARLLQQSADAAVSDGHGSDSSRPTLTRNGPARMTPPSPKSTPYKHGSKSEYEDRQRVRHVEAAIEPQINSVKRADRTDAPSPPSAASGIQTRDRTLSGSLTPRIMTPQVWGGSGETRSPKFRPNMLINPRGKSVAGSEEKRDRSSLVTKSNAQASNTAKAMSSATSSALSSSLTPSSSASSSSSSSSSAAAPPSSTATTSSSVSLNISSKSSSSSSSDFKAGGTETRPTFSYQKLTQAALDSKDGVGSRSSKRNKSPSGNSGSSNSPGAKGMGVAESLGEGADGDEGSSEKAATFGGSPSSGPVARDALSQSMPALKSKRTYDVGGPNDNRQSTMDHEGAMISSSSAFSASSSSSSSSSSGKKKSPASKISAGQILSKVKQLRIAENLKLDEQLQALEQHERQAKEEEETRLELLRQKEERERRARAEEEEQRRKDKAIKQRLTRGHLFYKHGRNRRAERRFVYVTPQLDTIAWRSVTSKTDSKPSKMYQVADLIRVTAGLNDGKTKSVQSNDFCLTLHLPSRTIQLECDNQTLRDAWLEAFRWLKINHLGREISEIRD